jgi:hypothetical protein
VTDIKLPGGVDGSAGAEPAPRLRRGAPVSRHGAISRELTKYSSYKTWAEKVRGVFAADAADPPGVNGSGPSRRPVDR